MKIIAIAPTRVSLFCGGCDVEPFCSRHGAKVINFAINLRHKATLIPSNDEWIWIEAMGETRVFKKDDIPDAGTDQKFDLIYQAVRQYKIPSGFRFTDEFDGIQGSGVGSSASAAVTMVGVFNRWLGVKEPLLEIAKKAQEMETSLGWISGWQDQMAAVFGGFNYFEANGFPRKVFPISFFPDIFGGMALFFTGKTRHSAEIQKELIRGMLDEKKADALIKSNELTAPAIEAIGNSDLQALGKLLHKSWALKKRANPMSTNERIDKIYNHGLGAGAYGGKILGAGGEGHLLFIIDREKRESFVEIMENFGVKHIDFSIDHNGLEVRSV